MNIRFAEQKDCDAIVELLRLSHSNAGYEFEFLPSYAKQLFALHTTTGFACCIVMGNGEPKGLLMASIMDHPFGAGLFAKETVWFIHPHYRGVHAVKMLRFYEQWAKSKGCKFVGMASLVGTGLDRFYGRMGYNPTETHFIKAVR